MCTPSTNLDSAVLCGNWARTISCPWGREQKADVLNCLKSNFQSWLGLWGDLIIPTLKLWSESFVVKSCLVQLLVKNSSKSVLRSRTPSRKSDVLPKQLQEEKSLPKLKDCTDCSTWYRVPWCLQSCSVLLLVHSRGSGAKLGMDYKRVEVTTKVVVEGDLDKVFGGEWEKYEANAWSLYN